MTHALLARKGTCTNQLHHKQVLAASEASIVHIDTEHQLQSRSATATERTDRPTPQSVMAFTLPKLPYDYTSLEPSIDAQTMQIHHGKHHQVQNASVN
jgi:hypothetical protein